MKIFGMLKLAEEIDVPRQTVIKARQRYITSRLPAIDVELGIFREWMQTTDINGAFVAPDFCDLLIEKCSLLRELHAMKGILNPSRDEITDTMIESARQVPVDQLIDFSRRKAKAWCHEDRNPSLVHATRINKAWCPVCGRYFGPIDVLMDRDGMTFRDAVKTLA